MEYDIFKSVYCGGSGHDKVGARQADWSRFVEKEEAYNRHDINSIYRKAEGYNKSREYCGCMVEVKEVVQ